jgi:hypothetical protein
LVAYKLYTGLKYMSSKVILGLRKKLSCTQVLHIAKVHEAHLVQMGRLPL